MKVGLHISNFTWDGGALLARFTASPKNALSLRASYYRDRQGAMSGTAQTLHEVTATAEHQPAASRAD